MTRRETSGSSEKTEKEVNLLLKGVTLQAQKALPARYRQADKFFSMKPMTD
jgi:hypothetical protein